MAYKIKSVRFPYVAVDIVNEALQRGDLSLYQIADYLAYKKAKTYAEGYLHFCLQTRLLRPAGKHTTYKYDRFLPTVRGREFYLEAQESKTTAMQALLGSLPYYRLHAEFLLAGVCYTTEFYRPDQTRSMFSTIEREIPWYETERISWIRQKLGIKGKIATSKKDLDLFEWAIQKCSPQDPFIDVISYHAWDEQLEFIGRSGLTLSYNLTQYLREQYPRPLIADLDLLGRENFYVLLLLTIAQSEGLALLSKPWQKNIEALQNMGFHIRTNEGESFLVSPVRMIVPGHIVSSPVTMDDIHDRMIETVIEVIFINKFIKEALAENQGQAVVLLDLREIYQIVKQTFSNLFAASELCFTADKFVPEPSRVEVWQDLPIWEVGQGGFHNEVREICKPDGQGKPSGEIRLTDQQLVVKTGESIGDVAKRLPHVYLLLMLLVDKEQSKISPQQNGTGWTYGGEELLPVLDQVLQTLGYTIWNEFYTRDAKRRRAIADQMVGLLNMLHVTEVRFGRLELTEDFSHRLMDDYAYLSSQTKFVRQRMRQIAQNKIVINGRN